MADAIAPSSGGPAGLGAGVQWAEAWGRASRRPGAVFGLAWLGVVAFFGVFAPLLANGRPLLYRELNDAGATVRAGSPLLERLSAVDLVLIAAVVLGLGVLVAPARTSRWARTGMLLAAGAQAAVVLAVVAGSRGVAVPETWLPLSSLSGARLVYGVMVGVGVGLLFLAVPSTRRSGTRLALVGLTALIAGGASGFAWSAPLRETRYAEETAAGRARAVFTVIPHSPEHGRTERSFLPPGSAAAAAALPDVMRAIGRHAGAGGAGRERLDVAVTPGVLAEIETAVLGSGLEPADADGLVGALRSKATAGELADGRAVAAAIRSYPGPRFLLGTDGFGRDVLSQMLHACRLSISIGLVSTGLAVVIGVTLGAIMGYFGGIADLVLSRVVEVFMAVPLLFLLIVAAGVLPPEFRGTYTMMAIIGCFTWTGAARFTRAEFLRLRGQDFVQSARALGLPLRSVLFRHMLPNGVTPVLVEASFGVAAAITIEATLSYLGLGPVDQPSWGRLLAGAYDQGGTFLWWMAVFPGGAIFLTVLSYNLIGEALRDAIDPKIRGSR